jgi:hypothetical protein
MGERLLGDEVVLVLKGLSGEPEEGLPAVQLFSRQMFEKATNSTRNIP